MILSEKNDPMGSAILDYQKTGKAGKLRVLSSMFEDDEIPAVHLFRNEEQMPDIERTALGMAKGKILDIGAGAGCHSIALQNKGFKVTAVDISPLSCQAMKDRGIQDVRNIDILDNDITEKFDTILMLMNGTGIAGTVDGLGPMLQKVSSLLSEDGCILIDSSDLIYLYENEDGSVDIDLAGSYYGEIDYKMVYKKVKGEPFNWLYADFSLLSSEAEKVGLKCELIEEGEHYDYLAKISK